MFKFKVREVEIMYVYYHQAHCTQLCEYGLKLYQNIRASEFKIEYSLIDNIQSITSDFDLEDKG